MNIIPIKDASFDDNATLAMNEAFDHACLSLHRFGTLITVRELIAKRIIEAAKNGERDPVQTLSAVINLLTSKICRCWLLASRSPRHSLCCGRAHRVSGERKYHAHHYPTAAIPSPKRQPRSTVGIADCSNNRADSYRMVLFPVSLAASPQLASRLFPFRGRETARHLRSSSPAKSSVPGIAMASTGLIGRAACASPRTRPCRSRPWRSAHQECRGRRGR